MFYVNIYQESGFERKRMITLSFRRKSVCMGDDAGNGEYTIEMPDTATLGSIAEGDLK